MKRAATTVVAAAAVLLFLAGPAGARDRLSAREFSARIDRARSIALAGESTPAPARMRAVEAGLGLPVDVDFAWGRVTIERDVLLSGLKGDRAGDFQAAVAHLDAMEEALREAQSATPPDRDRVREALRSSYGGIQAQRNILQRVRERLLEAAGAVLERIAQATASGLGKVVGLALVAGLVALAAFLIGRRIRIVPERMQRERAGAGARVDWRVLAADAEARGDLEGAVRAQYQILLEELAARDIVHDEPSLTAGECRIAVAGNRPQLYPVVADATDAFEHVVYGHTSPRTEHVERLRRAMSAARAA